MMLEHIGIIKTACRGLQLLFVLLATALIGNVIHTSVNPAGSATAAIGFCMFPIVWTWIATLYGLAGRFYNPAEHSRVNLALDGVAVFLNFLAGVVLAAKLKVVNCGDLDRKELPKSYIAWGSDNDEKRCREIQASTVFFWFELILFVMTGFIALRESRRGIGMSVGSAPSMAQFRGV